MTVRVTTLKGGGIVNYLESQGVSLYYAADPVDPPGQWLGDGAVEFGLAGDVDRGPFQALIEGHHPQRGTQLGRVYGKSSARAYDVTFNAPKSVSLLWAFGDQSVREHVTAAHDRSVRRVLRFIEDQGHTRVTPAGQTLVVDTRGLTIAAFRQHTSRTEDPHLHTHAAVLGKVQDGCGGWYALDARMIKHDQRTLSALYHAGLRSELTRRLGVAWGVPENGIAEIAHVRPDMLAAFSERTGQVEARYQIKLDRFRETVGREPSRRERWRLERESAADSRPGKRHDHPLAELEDRWVRDLAGLGLTPDGLVDSMTGWQLERRGMTSGEADRIARDALAELQDTRSTWRRNDVVCEIARRIPTAVSVDADRLGTWIEQCADVEVHHHVELAPRAAPTVARRRDGRPVTESTLDRRLTTTHILREEEWLATWAMARQETAGVADVRLDTTGLDHAQAVAARAVAGTDALVLIVGPAGAGKTSTLRAAGHGLTGTGRSVLGLAPSATAAAVLTAGTGIPADTVDKLLYEHAQPDRAPHLGFRLGCGSTVIVDEAGMLATPKLAAFARLADTYRWRVVLVGDPHQLDGVGRSGMFTHLTTHERVIELDRIHRFHQPWERAASVRLRAGDPDVLAVYERHGRLHDGTHLDMTTEILTDWRTGRAQGQSVAMLAVTTETVDRLNQLAQRARAAAGALDTGTTIAGRDGIAICVGDQIVTRTNDRSLCTDRGAMIRNRAGWTVTGITGTGITATGSDGSVHLPSDYVRASVELGYAHTVHGAQGITVDRSLLLVDGPVDGRAIYVGLTRGRIENHAYVAADAHHTARDILEPAIVSDWADRPAIDVRAELSKPRPTITIDQRPSHVPRSLPDNKLRALLAAREHLRHLDLPGHSARYQQLRQANNADHQQLTNHRQRRDELIRQRVELTAERAQLPPIGRGRLRRDLDHQVDATEAQLQQTGETIAMLEAKSVRRGIHLRIEQRWLEEHPDVLHQLREIDRDLETDAATRGQHLSRQPKPDVIDRFGAPPHHDERALHHWERNAGRHEQRRIELEPRLSVAVEHELAPVTTRQPSRTIEIDLGLGL